MSLKLKMKKALSNYDLYKLFDNKINIYTYNELTKFNNIDDAFDKFDVIFLLFETKKNFGHWVCLIKTEDFIEHFDSYGIFPDKELKYTNKSFRMKNNMMLPHLTYLLLKSNKKIEYNDHQLQSKKYKWIATCGRFCALRYMCKDYNIDVFADFFLRNKKYTPDEIVTLLTYYI